ncbi:SAM-dependent methyltransferase [Acinetobacter larvae]|uniref:SAM-dependent methyltransferase n=2 Tax=Acinetobacter larvae TaxID=1789224 RepID=A0A1B2LVH8_9GAMM|nr:SAM-dependent methyltransferase [Acinetobacter larvae]
MKTPYLEHNRQAWDHMAQQDCPWSRAVSAADIAAARAGQWHVKLTPNAMPKGWLDEVKGLKILCLASGGGQQAPILAAAGADVTVLDASLQQLAQDQMVATRDQLQLQIIQGDMCDLSQFNDQQFDVIFHPISNLYIPDPMPVWQECFRVLKVAGHLLSSFYNPVVFVGDRQDDVNAGIIHARYKIPYADVKDLSQAQLQQKIQQQQALVFGHSLTQQIAGQLDAGFLLKGFYEDFQPQPRFVIDHYLPTFLATRVVKP